MAPPPGDIARRVAAFGRGLDPSLALLAAIAFATQVGVAVMLPLLPLYATDLGATPLVLALLTSSFAVTNSVGQLLAGFVAQRIGPRRLVPAGMGLYAGANLFIAAATAALPLIAWRSIAGLGAGLALVSERLYLIGVVDRARLAFANGLLSAAGSAGTVAGPTVGGIVAAASDLRAPFILVAATSAVAAAAALFLPRPKSERVAAAGLAAQTATAGGDAAAVTGATAAGALPAGSEPAAGQLDRRRLSVLLFANVGLLAGFGSFITTYGPFATEVLGWSEAQIGLQFSLFGLGSILVGPWLAHQADRRGRQRVALVALLPVLLFALALVGALPSPVLAIAGVAAGGGIAGFEAAWYALLGDATGGARGGRAFGTVSALSNLGIVVGAILAGALWTAIDVRAGLAAVILAVVWAGLGMLLLEPDIPPKSAPDDTEPAGDPAADRVAG